MARFGLSLRRMELAVENLTVTRGWRAVFAGLGFRLDPGAALLLRGPNGAGKSTLLRCLAGFIRAETGDAALGGISLRSARADFLDRSIYTGHLDALKPALTARETLQFHADLFGAAPARIDQALDAMALSHLADQPVRILSAGQKRRLGLARLVLVERTLWLLDEPTVSLDAESSARVAALARAHCEAGGMVIAATHIDLELPSARVLNPADFRREASPRAAQSKDDAVLRGDVW